MKKAVENVKKDIKIVCVQTEANEQIPSGAINFADLIDTNSKCDEWLQFQSLPVT